MPRRKQSLETGEYYHVYNRGVDKRRIFQSVRDYQRFMLQLYAFNDLEVVSNYSYYASLGFDVLRERKRRKPLVSVVAFCLMSNHFHLLLRQIEDGGISLYLQKTAQGLSQYFNLKYERTGTLFQGRFGAKHVNDDAYLRHVVSYIHINPLSLLGKTGEGEPKRHSATRSELERYAWSSYSAYIGVQQEGDLAYDVLDHDIIGNLGLLRGKSYRQDIQKTINLSRPGRDKGDERWGDRKWYE